MKTIKERRKEILQWERDNRNSNNRSVDAKTKGCIYSGEIGCAAKGCIYSGEIGCAVGRLIEDKDLCSRLDNSALSGVCRTEVFNQLPENVKELGQEFLQDLQKLHDNYQYWNENGLSDSGNKIMMQLETRWC